MNQTTDILRTLKKCLRAKGLKYSDVAIALDISEASVKRIFSQETFTLSRLEQICRFLEMSVYDLTRLTHLGQDDELTRLSEQQEQGLADDPLAITYFFLMLTGRTPEKIAAEFGLDERQQTTMLVRLSRLKLVELYPNNSGRLLTGRRVEWRKNGPIRKVYERQVTEAFMSSNFTRRDESWLFDTGELSDASAKVMMRKFEKLTQEFNELADLDISMPAKRKKAFAVLIAFRPWTYWTILEQTANDMGLNAERSQVR
jgi:DNA-binding Xre family transcriptional regulator